jgi:tetratricopeptide (TPR) repeat protein
MRPTTIFVLVSALLLPATAETIRLKNGRSILADTVQEKGNKIEYTVGEDTYAISKSSVDRIDTGGSPVVTRSAPPPVTDVDLSGLISDATLEESLFKNGSLDTDLLAEVDRQGPPERAASANLIAAARFRAGGKLSEAVRYLEAAKGFLPNNGIIATNYAIVLTELNRFPDAARAAESAAKLDPNLAAAHSILGYSYYQLGRLKEAIPELKKSLELGPTKEAADLLKRAERELNTESGFNQEASNHFALKFEGEQVSPALRRQILDVLEQSFSDLERDLDYTPRNPIQVILYTNKQFFDVTRAPGWTGALNDGRLRIPISGISVVDSNLARVLKHELTHSFVNLASNGRAPTWLHEGVAQLEEPQTTARDGRRLSALYESAHNIPINQLESSFQRFSEAEAAVAYAQSLASAEYIREVYGMSSISLLLKRMGEGQSNESALRTAVHSGYAAFDRDVGMYLKKTYD